MINYKLAAIDIDDTLVGHDKRISRANADAVKHLRSVGCRVVLASGRRHDNMLGFSRELGLDDYLVSCQGAMVRCPRTGEVIHEALLPAPDAAELTAEGLDRGLCVMYWSHDGVFARQRSRWTDQYTVDTGGDPITLLDVQSLADANAPAEKLVWGAEPAVIASLERELRPRYAGRLELTRTEDWFLEFTAPAATKAVGVAAVAKAHGIDRTHVMAFGDGNNDVSLLTWAGLGVAMSHGRSSAKVAARMTAPAGDPESALSRAVALITAPAETSVPDEEREATGAAA